MVTLAHVFVNKIQDSHVAILHFHQWLSCSGSTRHRAKISLLPFRISPIKLLALKAGMVCQVIDGRYIDRKKLIALLEGLFPKETYEVRASGFWTPDPALPVG